MTPLERTRHSTSRNLRLVVLFPKRFSVLIVLCSCAGILEIPYRNIRETKGQVVVLEMRHLESHLDFPTDPTVP